MLPRGAAHRAILLLGLALLAGPRPSAAATQKTAPPAVVHEHTPSIHAFINARIVAAPGRVIARGTLVARDGVITAMGAAVRPPADAVVHDLSGKTLYPAFVEMYSEIGLDPGAWNPGAESARGAAYWNRYMVPQRRAALEFQPDTAAAAALRSQGFAVALTAPPWGVVKGTSAVISLGEGAGAELVMKPQAALHVALTPPGWKPGYYEEEEEEDRGYPGSPMGAVALVRQAFYDADWYAAAQVAWAKNPSLPRPETDEALETLAALRRARVPVVVDAPDEKYALRADRMGRELGLDVIVRGSGREYRRLDALRAAGRAILVPVNFPKPPVAETPEDALNVSLESLLHWDLAPGNPARLSRAGIPVAFTTYGLEDRRTFLTQVRRAVARGLSPDAALAALTTTPAGLLGLASRIGTLDAGKAANLIVADGDLFKGKSEIREVWVEGVRYPVRPAPRADVRGSWIAEFTPRRFAPGDTVRFLLGGTVDSLGGKVQRSGIAARGGPGARAGGPPSAAATVSLLETHVFLSFAADSLGVTGTVRMSGAASANRMLGEGTWPDGAAFTWTATRAAPFTPPPDTAKAAPPDTASFPVRYPLQAFGRLAPPPQPDAVLFRGATVWTCGPAGTLDGADVLVTRGRIAAVGRGLKAPAGAVVVDAGGMQLTPGMIDCHSHIATDGGVNEGTHSSTPEVRIGDFVDPDDETIYRQLGGGVTASHVLHGSANTIGGQCLLIKMRWGADPEALEFDGAPPTIKFALGENVKQSNWGEKFKSRFPQTRMGVEQVLRDRLQAARDYERAWAEWRRTKRGIPPRRDLGLDALVEVLRGKRFIHCHSYRQDEILMLMRVCDDFGVRSVTYQHVLEGYKVADELARRGDGASTFSDWWAYKMEVYDAIPYNAALMHDAGVVVSINSDSHEMGRRLNQEAGKCIQYGGLSPEEALRLVTLYPAKQLRVDGRVGTIEVGKDADLALWSGPPLAQESRCEQTWVDGRKYFDRAEDLASRSEMERMKETLLQKALRAGRK